MVPGATGCFQHYLYLSKKTQLSTANAMLTESAISYTLVKLDSNVILCASSKAG